MQFIPVEQIYDITALLATYLHKYGSNWLKKLRDDLKVTPLSKLMANVATDVDIKDMDEATASLYDSLSKIGGRFGIRRSLNAFITMDLDTYKAKLDDNRYKLLQEFKYEFNDPVFLLNPPDDAPVPNVTEFGYFLGVVDALASRAVPFAIIKDDALHVTSLFIKTFINMRDLGLFENTVFEDTRFLIHNEQPIVWQSFAEVLQYSGPYLSSFDVIFVMPEFQGSYDEWQIILSIIEQAGIPILFVEGPTLEPFISYLTGYLKDQSDIIILDPKETKRPWVNYLINFRNKVRSALHISPKLQPTESIKAYKSYIRSALPVIKQMEHENLSSYIGKRFFEQDKVIDDIIRWILLHKHLAMKEPLKRPFSMLFVGTTGTGKSYLARLLIEYFDVPSYTIHGSLFSEQHTIRILLGAPPSYVGFGLVPAFEKFLSQLGGSDRFPAGILVIDEAEKMCLEVVNRILVPLLDGEGIQFADDKHVIPYNLMVIATANGDAAELSKSIGFEQQTLDDQKMVMEAIEKYMTPEVLARFTASYFFYPLSVDALYKIAVREFKRYASDLFNKSVAEKLRSFAERAQHARDVERQALMYAFSLMKGGEL